MKTTQETIGAFTYYWNPNDEPCIARGELAFITRRDGFCESPYMALYADGYTKLLSGAHGAPLTQEQLTDLTTLVARAYKG